MRYQLAPQVKAQCIKSFGLITLLFTDLLLIYSDEKYKGIYCLPNCTCMPCFNFRHSV